ncbi:MAG: peptidyl-prolyl cis-trans isomerase SurA [Bacteroidia bacterium]|jgi:peptidyl-prolyl cis-trans isomerase SurA
MTKIIKFLFILTVCFFYSVANAQMGTLAVTSTSKDAAVPSPIFSYGDEVVYGDEFMRVFNKNKREENAPTQEEIEEYLDLYVKFKLKVAEAYSRKMDTVPSFINELAGYREQLAQPYLTDKSVTDMLVKQAFDRSQQEVNASHLLINCPLDAKPADSLAAYQKILGLRNRIEKGEDFSTIATQYSEDPSAKSNAGNLGYFTAFQMIYPFENAAFNTAVGSVSMPIRTRFGYHLVHVIDRRKSMGDVKVGHIMIKYYNEGQIDSTKKRIDAVLTKLKAGADWNKTVEEFSEDFNTNSKGGELSWFSRTTSNVPNEFKDAAYGLEKDGDFSTPFKTKFGWHIIRRVEIKSLPEYDEMKDVIRRKVERDTRSELNKDVVVARVKIENKFKEVKGLDSVKGNFGEELIRGKFKKKEGTGMVLFQIANKSYTDSDFYTYVLANQGKTNKTLANAVIDLYSEFVKQSNLDYEKSILEVKYDDFKYIMQEYKDGILLFELTDNEVWSKAVADSAGLESFYAKNQANYMWKERADASIFSCKDAKVAKKAKKSAKKGATTNEILAKYNAKDPLAITVEQKNFEKGTNKLLDAVSWNAGVYNLANENDRVKFARINNILAPSAKPLESNMGQATSDYQNYLEAEWLNELRKKYPVQIYDDNVAQLY